MGKTRESANLVSFNNLFSDIANQRIGIGVVNPSSALEIFGTGTDSWNIITFNGNSKTNNVNKGGIIRGARKNNSSVPFTAFGTWDDGTAKYLYIGGGGWNSPEATEILFYTEPTYSETNNAALERMRIAKNGNIGINNSNPTSKLSIVGDVLVSGVITCTDLNSTSDANLKTNLQEISNPLSKTLQLNGYTFNWKETNKPSMGVIAQELEKIFPQLVSGVNQKSVNYNGIIAVLIESIKELNQKVEDLTEELKSIRMDQ